MKLIAVIISIKQISLWQKKLNIKFAPNGTGKSTVSRAIQCTVNGDEQGLSDLLPFRYRGSNPDAVQPVVTGVDGLQNVMCFNEKYVDQFTFQPDELVSNSFDIFIKSEAYHETEREIEAMVAAIRQQFADNVELEEFITHLGELSAAFKLSSSGIAKTSTGMKGLSTGNKLQHIPAGLESYKPYIQSKNSVEWIEWQTRGYEKFSALSDGCCPFCTGDSREKAEQISRVSAEYDKAVIKKLIGVLDKLGEYFSEPARARLADITTLKSGLEKQHEECVVAG